MEIEKTKVGTTAGSLTTTIPKGIAEAMGIGVGDDIFWVLDTKADRLIITKKLEVKV